VSSRLELSVPSSDASESSVDCCDCVSWVPKTPVPVLSVEVQLGGGPGGGPPTPPAPLVPETPDAPCVDWTPSTPFVVAIFSASASAMSLFWSSDGMPASSAATRSSCETPRVEARSNSCSSPFA
jgi:hypothetical protein